ncbi:hypothetical protein JYU34_019897 [Plutella xylostella]|uniref:Cation-transporting ATPase n=1 Tax=Plutella xylostella TaxID=51655 RepID=A0ABQ7PVN2_PLUXY|nr:hypothetical protein JYU34_019897 [Plutella xylostella]
MTVKASKEREEQSEQYISADDAQMVVYGYRRSGWRKALVYSISTLLAGLPFLVFHWCPTWLLYATALRCPFHVADLILVVETYQKKCKSHYIHKIYNKNIGETRGQSNAGFQGEGDHTQEKPPILEDRLTPIHLEDGTKLHVSHYRYFVHKKCVFVWTAGAAGARGAAWGRLAGIERGATCASLHRAATELLDHDAMLHVYGSNTISVPVDSVLTLTLREIFNPFYIFQACTIALWLAEPYYYYCVAVVLMSTFGVTTSVIQTRRNQQNLRATVESQDTVEVLINGTAVTVPSDQLSPGDVLLLPAHGGRLHCDAALLSGTALLNESISGSQQRSPEPLLPARGGRLHYDAALLSGTALLNESMLTGDVLLLPAHGGRLHCDAALLSGTALLNESMLTGESVPVSKTALPRTNVPFDEKQHAAHTLYCGTHVIQTRYLNEPVKALVIRTGYHTSKGQLVRSILYPIPADFKFDRDSYKFILILTAIAILGLAYTVALKAYRSISPGDITLKALDIITIVVPPALPAAMTVGRLYAVSRLKRARVACLNTRAVNVSGSLDCMCFDKTGTLTEDGLAMWGCVPVSHATLPPCLSAPVRDPRALNDLHELKMGMASCHSLTKVEGELSGDPLDLEMFKATGWLLEEPDVPETANYDMLTPTVVRPSRNTNINVDDYHLPLEVGIILQNQFVSSLARASVATRTAGEDVVRVYCKGAPDTLHQYCRPETVPANLNSILSQYAEKGYRVIALASRVMEVTYKQLMKMTREEVSKSRILP